MDAFLSEMAGYWDIPIITANFVAFFHMLLALMLGLVVGYERSYRGRAAGMRTYGMVCMASCALTVIAGYPEYWYGGHATHIGTVDPGRIIQGLMTGIGFLGAGVIMRDGLNISGLTTAASIWSVAAIGVLVGVGYFGGAVFLTFLSGLLMMWGGKIENFLPSRHAVAVTLHFHKGTLPTEKDLNHMFLDRGYEIARGSFAVGGRSGHPEWKFVVVSLGRGRGDTLINLSSILSSTPHVESFNLSHARN